MSLSFSLILDILIAVLLVATIGYAIALNRRLTLLRKDKDELEALTMKFAQATTKADASIQNLKGSTESVAQELEKGLAKAEALRDDLSFLIDRGGSIADRLEGGVRGARNESPSVAPSKAPPSPPVGIETVDMDAPEEKPKTKTPPRRVPDPSDEGPGARSKAEQELLKALQSMR